MERGNGDGKHRDGRNYEEEPSSLDPVPSLDVLAYQVRTHREEARKWEQRRDKETLHLTESIQGLVAMVQHSEQARSEDMRSFSRELRQQNKAIGDLSEQVGRLLAEIAANSRQDSIQDDILTDVQKIAKNAHKTSQEAVEAAKNAERKKQLVIFGQRSAPTALVLAVYEIGQRLGWW